MITTEKVTVSLSKEVIDTLREKIPKRRRSKFIEETIKKRLQKMKEQSLIKEYKEAYSEIEKESQEFDGVNGDGLS